MDGRGDAPCNRRDTQRLLHPLCRSLAGLPCPWIPPPHHVYPATGGRGVSQGIGFFMHGHNAGEVVERAEQATGRQASSTREDAMGKNGVTADACGLRRKG